MHPSEIKAAFDRGDNITKLLRDSENSATVTEEIIETAYDLQAGSYIRALGDPAMRDHKQKYGAAIAAEIERLTAPTSIVETGVGEGTTLSFVVNSFAQAPSAVHGLDISWSRIARCHDWLKNENVSASFLSVASILHTPYAEHSFDVVYTSHTIEPNGGNERPILAELYRIASRYLVLLEPGYETASDEAQSRMTSLGYCRGLVEHAEALGMRVIKHEPFAHVANPLNPTAITVIAKNPDAAPATPRLVCPRYREPLTEFADSLYSRGSLRAYPKVKGIPCLRPEDGIVASGYEELEVENAECGMRNAE